MKHWHLFPIDPSQDAAGAWAELTTVGRRITFSSDLTVEWGTRHCDGSECARISERVAGHP